ncbi:MAG: MBL fold metallo-hydrolase [Chloroflexi bacterium]|nr:MBL fold metallo-hydrolase [Chloroflexota bacterium]
MASVDEIAEDIFRINLAPPGRPVTFSLFAIQADEPALVETSFGRSFDEVREAVARVLDPRTIRHILVPHFEADECGAMNHFLELAPNAVVLGSPRGASSSLADFALRPPRAVQDGELLDLGGKRLRVLLTPYVHQWDALLAYEETTGTLFSSDLFMQPGQGPASTEADLTETMVAYYRQSGIWPSMPHLHAALDQIEPLPVQCIACHHGSTIAGPVVRRYFQAIREHDVTAFAQR